LVIDDDDDDASACDRGAIDGQKIDYHAAVEGGLLLVPDHDVRDALAKDYRHIIDDGLLFDEAEPFHKLMERCEDLQDRANNGAENVSS